MKDNILDRFIIYVLQVRILLLLNPKTHTHGEYHHAWGVPHYGEGRYQLAGPVLLCHCLVLGRVGSVGTDRYDNITPIYCIYIITPIIIQHTILVNSTPPAPGKNNKKNGLNYSDYPFCFSIHLYQ